MWLEEEVPWLEDEMKKHEDGDSIDGESDLQM